MRQVWHASVYSPNQRGQRTRDHTHKRLVWRYQTRTAPIRGFDAIDWRIRFCRVHLTVEYSYLYVQNCLVSKSAVPFSGYAEEQKNDSVGCTYLTVTSLARYLLAVSPSPLSLESKSAGEHRDVTFQ